MLNAGAVHSDPSRNRDSSGGFMEVQSVVTPMASYVATICLPMLLLGILS